MTVNFKDFLESVKKLTLDKSLSGTTMHTSAVDLSDWNDIQQLNENINSKTESDKK